MWVGGGGVGMCVGVGMCAWLTFESDVELGACVAANLVASIAMMMFNGRTPTSLVTPYILGFGNIKDKSYV